MEPDSTNIFKPKEYYDLMAQLTTYGAVAFAVISAFLGALAFNYSQIASKAEKYQKTWIDDYPNEAAIRVHLYSGNEFLRWKNFELLVNKKISDTVFEKIAQYNFIAGESEIYLPIGIYEITVFTKEYVPKKYTFGIDKNTLHERMNFSINLEKLPSK